MAEGRSKALWTHTSTVIATIAEVHRDRNKRPEPFSPIDFNPYIEKKKEKKPEHKMSMRELHAMMPNLPDALGRAARAKARRETKAVK